MSVRPGCASFSLPGQNSWRAGCGCGDSAPSVWSCCCWCLLCVGLYLIHFLLFIWPLTAAQPPYCNQHRPQCSRLTWTCVLINKQLYEHTHTHVQRWDRAWFPETYWYKYAGPNDTIGSQQSRERVGAGVGAVNVYLSVCCLRLPIATDCSPLLTFWLFRRGFALICRVATCRDVTALCRKSEGAGTCPPSLSLILFFKKSFKSFVFWLWTYRKIRM